MDFNKVQDSGSRQEFVTGAVRDLRAGKGRFDLIPKRGIRRLARHFENGAVKYGDNNWRKGINMHCYLDSVIRHAFDYLDGDRSEDHLAAVAWNAICAMHTEEMIDEGKLPAELADILSDVPKAGECIPLDTKELKEGESLGDYFRQHPLTGTK